MPSDWLQVDSGFPTFTGKESQQQKIDAILNHLFLLQEQLRYTLRNLDFQKNMNQTAVTRFQKTITDPILAKIQDTDGNVAQLQLTAQGLQSTVSNQAGQISTLQQTVGGIQTTVSNQAGQISTLQQTVGGIQTTVSNQAGQISTLQQTVGGIQTTVSNQAGQISTLQQTVGGIQTTVANQAGQITTAQQTADKISWLVASGTDASNFTLTSRVASLVANEINISGYVKFSNLGTVGETSINAGNLSTGTINAANVHLKGTMEVYRGSDLVGYLGSYFGATDQNVTWGTVMARNYTHYLLATGSGVRMQSNQSDIYVADGEARLRPNGPLYLGGGRTTGIVLTSASYGTTLPTTNLYEGRLFFKI